MTTAAWEEIDNGEERVRRLPVPGGWLYQVGHFVVIRPPTGASTEMLGWHAPVFVPEPRS